MSAHHPVLPVRASACGPGVGASREGPVPGRVFPAAHDPKRSSLAGEQTRILRLMDNDLASKWRAACIAVETACGLEDADGELLRFVEQAQSGHVARSEAISLLTKALDQRAPWEALAYSFHVLRWPELLSVLEDRREAWVNDPRAQNVWVHLRDAFNPAWEDRDLFPSLST